MGERVNKRAAFKVGDVISAYLSGGGMYLVLERRHDYWPTWQSEGLYWQWKLADLETGETHWALENAIDFYHVLGK